MTLYTKITIDGTTVTDTSNASNSDYLIGYEVEDLADNTPTSADIEFSMDIHNDIDLATRMLVVITKGSVTSTDEIIFQGYITNVVKLGGKLKVECTDKIRLLQDKTYNGSYDKDVDSQAGVISAIAEDLIEVRAGLGLTASVESTGSVNVVDKFICRHDVIFERLKKLADLVNYQVYYNSSTDVFHFESKGYPSYANTLTVNEEIVNIPDWSYNYDEIANFIKIGGAYDEVETTDLFSGDGAETTFTLGFEPVSIKVFVGGNLQIGGITGSTETFDYYVDKLNKNLIFNAGSIPAGGTDNIEVRYSYKVARLVTVKDDDSINAYGTKDLVKNFIDILDVEDARERGMKLLNRRKNPYVSASLLVMGAEALKAGMMVTVVDSVGNENRTLLAKRVVWKYPQEMVEVDVGDVIVTDDELFININERLRMLERETMGDVEIVDQTLQFTREIDYGRRYMKLLKKTIDDTDILIWDHPTQGEWDDDKWGTDADSPFGAETTERIIWPNDTFIERFKDTTFTGTGTATVNTTERRLEL